MHTKKDDKDEKKVEKYNFFCKCCKAHDHIDGGFFTVHFCIYFGSYVCIVYFEHNSTHFLNANQYLVEMSFAVIEDFTDNEFNPNMWNLYVPKNEIPEFTLLHILPIFIVFSIIGVIVRNKLRKK